jgi:hypothetical protein
MSIKIPYMRKDTSTLLIISAAIALLLASSLLLSNPLIQPALAQTSMTFNTQSAGGSFQCCPNNPATPTFDAQGTSFFV